MSHLFPPCFIRECQIYIYIYICSFSQTRYTPANTFVAGFHFTIALLPSGPLLITHPPVWYKQEFVKTEKELEDVELKSLLARNLRENKKSKKNKKKAEEDGGGEDE